MVGAAEAMAMSRASLPSLVRLAFCFATPGSQRSSLLRSIRCQEVALLNARSINHAADSAGEKVLQENAKDLAPRLDWGQELQYWQRCRSLPFVCGAGAQDVSAVTLYKSPWPIYPSFSAHLACEGSSGKIRRSSYASVWRKSSLSATALDDSGDAQTVEQLWEEYFACPFQW